MASPRYKISILPLIILDRHNGTNLIFPDTETIINIEGDHKSLSFSLVHGEKIFINRIGSRSLRNNFSRATDPLQRIIHTHDKLNQADPRSSDESCSLIQSCIDLHGMRTPHCSASYSFFNTLV